MKLVLSQNIAPYPDAKGADYAKRLAALGHDVAVAPAMNFLDEGDWAVDLDPAKELCRVRGLIKSARALIVANTLSHTPVGVEDNVSPLSLTHMAEAHAHHKPVLLTEGRPHAPYLIGSPAPFVTQAGNMVYAIEAAATGVLEGDFKKIPEIIEAFDAAQQGGQ